MRHEVDMLIVGAGPTGLFASYYSGFRGLSVAIVDSLEEPGGQLTALYPEKMIYDVAGFPAVRSRDLVAELVAQASTYGPQLLLGRRALGLQCDDGGPVTIALDGGDEVRAKAVLVTAGMGTFSPRPLPAADGFAGRGLRFFIRDPEQLRGHDVVVVGGGDSALDWALGLLDVASTVTLVHRRAGFRAHEASLSKLLASPVEVLTPYQVLEVSSGPDGGIGSVTVAETGADRLRTLPCQSLIAALGFTADLGPLTTWGMELDHRHIVVDSRMATSVPRVFAAGDVTEYPGKVRLIAVGFGEAATAVNNAATVIDPSLKIFPGHSSDPSKTHA